MDWYYKSYSEKQTPAVVDKIIGRLDRLSPRQAASMKVAMSDMSGKDARGIVFWDADGEDVPLSSGDWRPRTFKTGNKYKEELYEPTLELLKRLSPAQALNARVTFTNLKSKNATMTIFYPEDP